MSWQVINIAGEVIYLFFPAPEYVIIENVRYIIEVPFAKISLRSRCYRKFIPGGVEYQICAAIVIGKLYPLPRHPAAKANHGYFAPQA